MRLNKFLALATGMSRRSADDLIEKDSVRVNGNAVKLGLIIDPAKDTVTLQGVPLRLPGTATTLLFHKPLGYVCSRNGQGSKTIYDLLPEKFHKLKPVGRLDKNSSGLLLLTNNGEFAHTLTHPSFHKEKIYEVELNSNLTEENEKAISDIGIRLDDGVSRLQLRLLDTERTKWQVRMSEGRNRQIRRTFRAIGHEVVYLHRTNFGTYSLGNLKPGEFKPIQTVTIQSQ